MAGQLLNHACWSPSHREMRTERVKQDMWSASPQPRRAIRSAYDPAHRVSPCLWSRTPRPQTSHCWMQQTPATPTLSREDGVLHCKAIQDAVNELAGSSLSNPSKFDALA